MLKESAGVKRFGTFMNVHGGVEHGKNIPVRGSVAPTKENRGEGVRGGTKMQRRDDTHVGKEPEKEIE